MRCDNAGVDVMVGASCPGVVEAHAVVEELVDVEGLGCP